LTFLDPERDPLGKGYQVTQSKIAIGSGGLLGKGVFNGSQNRLGFLTDPPHTTSSFSVVGEELGFAGVIATLGLLAFIIFRSIYNALTARDNFGPLYRDGRCRDLFFPYHRKCGNGDRIHADNWDTAPFHELWRVVCFDRLHRPRIGPECSPLPLRELIRSML
jgi:hypothetical protein